MTTPGETERIIRSLVRYNEELGREIARLKEVVADLRDQNIRRELGFPPRKLTPDYAKSAYIKEIEDRD